MTDARTCAREGCSNALDRRRKTARYCQASCRVQAFKDKAKGRSRGEAEVTLGTVPSGPVGYPERLPTSGSRYSDLEIDAGLTAVAMASGNTRQAEEALRQAGHRRIPRSTLKDWANQRYVERYRRIQAETLPELNARLAETHDALVAAYSQLQWETVERAREKLPEAKVSELAALMKAGAVGMGISTDKAKLRRGEPTQIHANESMSELMRRAQARWPQFFDFSSILEGTAEELEGPRDLDHHQASDELLTAGREGDPD
jgi:hypothetical protein